MDNNKHDELKHRIDLIWHSIGTLNLPADADDRDIAINHIQRFYGINRECARGILESGPFIAL